MRNSRFNAVAVKAGVAIALVACIAHTHGGVYAHYSFNVNYDDASGNGHDGTLTDVGTIGNSGITTTPGDFKFGGGALTLSSDRDYVDVPSKTFGSGSPYTIAFWAQKAETTRDWNMVIGRRGDGVFFIAPNKGGYARWRGADSGRQNDFNPIPNDMLWHHYVFTATSGGVLSLYLDGEFVEQSSELTGFIIDTIGEAYLAAGGFDFEGQLDEVWILDEALDADNVRHLYTFNALPEVLLQMPFDDGAGDESTMGNHGTLNGAASITTTATRLATTTTAAPLALHQSQPPRENSASDRVVWNWTAPATSVSQARSLSALRTPGRYRAGPAKTRTM